jgi:hypothetical protein
MKTKMRWKWHWIKNWIHKKRIIRILPFCHGVYGPCFRKGKRQRQLTSYVNDEKNWVFLCRKCAHENNERWKELWDDYYSGCV